MTEDQDYWLAHSVAWNALHEKDEKQAALKGEIKRYQDLLKNVTTLVEFDHTKNRIKATLAKIEQLDSLATDALQHNASNAPFLAALRQEVEFSEVNLSQTTTPTMAAATHAEDIRKKNVLIKDLQDIWPDIRTDLNDAGRNGLCKIAKHSQHGYWMLPPAIEWAVQRGKIEKSRAKSFISSNEESSLSPMLRKLLKLD